VGRWVTTDDEPNARPRKRADVTNNTASLFEFLLDVNMTQKLIMDGIYVWSCCRTRGSLN